MKITVTKINYFLYEILQILHSIEEDIFSVFNFFTDIK